MKETIIIRQATTDDLEVLRGFEQGVIAAERPFDSTLKDDPTHYYDLEEMVSASHIELLVAMSGSEIIASGYARIETAKPYLKHPRHAYLGFMYVRPDYRGKGVNRLIIGALKEWALSRNIGEMRLDVYFPNQPAIQAYEKAGFTRHMVEMRMGIVDDKHSDKSQEQTINNMNAR